MVDGQQRGREPFGDQAQGRAGVNGVSSSCPSASFRSMIWVIRSLLALVRRLFQRAARRFHANRRA